MSAFTPPKVGGTKRRAEVKSKVVDKRGNTTHCTLDVPDSVADVQSWLDKVYGNFQLIQLHGA